MKRCGKKKSIGSAVWLAVFLMCSVSGFAQDTSLGTGADAEFSGTAIGYYASAFSNGVAVGNFADGDIGGAAVGKQAIATNRGVAAGIMANGVNNGVALGNRAQGGNSGVAVGKYAQGTSGNIAIGANATATGGTARTAIGRNVTNNMDNVTVIRGTLALDGSDSKIFYRPTFGSGSFVQLPVPTLSGLSGGNLNYSGSRVCVDPNGLNSGNLNNYALVFGPVGTTGSGIAARHTNGGNQYGLDLYANSIPRISIANNGSVGFGTTAPTDALLDIEGNTRLNEKDLWLRAGVDRNHGLGWYGPAKPFGSPAIDGPVLYGWSSGALGSTEGGAKVALRWNQQGWVAINTNVMPAVPLEVGDSGRFMNATADGLVNIGNTLKKHITIDSDEIQARDGTKKTTLYLNNWGGNIRLGKGGDVVEVRTNTAGQTALAINFDGGVISSPFRMYVNGGPAYCTGGWLSTSDARYKKNVEPIEAALAKVMQLDGITFEWRQSEFPEKNFDSGRQIGFIAQDLEKVVPEVVTTDGAGYKSVDYDKLTALAVGALKEQQAEITSLKTQVAELKAMVETLAGKIK